MLSPACLRSVPRITYTGPAVRVFLEAVFAKIIVIAFNTCIGFADGASRNLRLSELTKELARLYPIPIPEQTDRPRTENLSTGPRSSPLKERPT